jgi:hypothetical protein
MGSLSSKFDAHELWYNKAKYLRYKKVNHHGESKTTLIVGLATARRGEKATTTAIV